MPAIRRNVAAFLFAAERLIEMYKNHDTQIKQMREERVKVLERSKSIVEKAEREKRDLTSKELEEISQLRYEAAGRQVELEALEAEERVLMESIAAGASVSPENWIDRRSGRVVRSFGPGESVAPYVRSRAAAFGAEQSGYSGEHLSAGRALRGILSGDWTGAEAEHRAIGTTGTGGIMVPAYVSAEWFDLARPQSACLAAGARIIPMEGKTLSLAAVDQDPEIEWKVENEPAIGSDISLREVKLVSRTLFIGPIAVSKELIMDAPNCEQVLNGVMSGALAVALDKAALLGDPGEVGPVGLVNTDGISEITDVGPVMGFHAFSQAYAELQRQNVDVANLSVVYNPDVSEALDTLTDDLHQPLNPPPSFTTLKNRLTTTQIPTETNETFAVMGDFGQMLIGTRLAIMIEASDSAGDAWASYQALFRGVLRADIALARPSHFCMIPGISFAPSP